MGVDRSCGNEVEGRTLMASWGSCVSESLGGGGIDQPKRIWG